MEYSHYVVSFLHRQSKEEKSGKLADMVGFLFVCFKIFPFFITLNNMNLRHKLYNLSYIQHFFV